MRASLPFEHIPRSATAHPTRRPPISPVDERLRAAKAKRGKCSSCAQRGSVCSEPCLPTALSSPLMPLSIHLQSNWRTARPMRCRQTLWMRWWRRPLAMSRGSATSSAAGRKRAKNKTCCESLTENAVNRLWLVCSSFFLKVQCDVP